MTLRTNKRPHSPGSGLRNPITKLATLITKTPYSGRMNKARVRPGPCPPSETRQYGHMPGVSNFIRLPRYKYPQADCLIATLTLRLVPNSFTAIRFLDDLIPFWSRVLEHAARGALVERVRD